MSSVITNKLGFIIKLIKEGDFKLIWKAFLRRLYSEEIAFGFKRDLSQEHPKPRTLIQLNIRLYKDSDQPFFIENINDGLIDEFKTCYVSTNKDGIPCFRLWLIDSTENDKLKNAWGNGFPQLSDDEVLLENVYTIPKFRGMGILPAVMYEVSEISKGLGTKYAITFGETNNLNTSRSYHYAGFRPYILRTRKWVFFRKKISYKVIPNDLLEQYEKATNRIGKQKK